MIHYQVLFIDVSMVRFQGDWTDGFIDFLNDKIKYRYYRNNCISLSKYTMFLFSAENDKTPLWILEDEFIGVALEEYCEKHPEHDTDLEMYFQEIKFVLLTISRKEALQYLRQYEKEFNHIESILK